MFSSDNKALKQPEISVCLSYLAFGGLQRILYKETTNTGVQK